VKFIKNIKLILNINDKLNDDSISESLLLVKL